MYESTDAEEGFSLEGILLMEVLIFYSRPLLSSSLPVRPGSPSPLQRWWTMVSVLG